MHLLNEHWPFVAFVVAIVGLLLLARIMFRAAPLPYEKRGAVVTNAELEFYRVLRESAGDNWKILAMVRLADLIVVKPDAPKRLSWQNRINGKHIDFVLCDPESLEPKIAIELDDRTHDRADRIQRDRFVNAAMNSAQLPLVRIKTARSYDADEIRRQIDEAAKLEAA